MPPSPSRPGESHPEPLTDPDVRLSPHPARATQRRLAPSGETAEFLRSPVDPTNTVSDPPPSLHGHYPASSLLWGGPRLLAHRYFQPRGSTACAFSLGMANQGLKFRTKAQMRVTPPEHRTPRGQDVGIFHADPGASGRPRFRCRRSLFRCVVRGSLALVSLISHPYLT